MTKKRFNLRNVVTIVISLAVTVMIAGCSKDNGNDPNNVVIQNVALTGTVRDVSGSPLSGVTVTTGTLSAITDSNGTFSFTQAGTINDRAVVKFEKSGYFTLTRSGDKEDEMYFEAMLYPKGNSAISLQTDFDASAAKTLQIGGVKIELPASCFANADGSAYNGTVRADVLLFNLADSVKTPQMASGGDLTCITAKNSVEMLIPIGMVDVELTDNNGNLLKIKDKTDIPISFSAPSGGNFPASIPQWTFDNVKGMWTEDGLLSLQGNMYSGTVSHFSPHAGGKSLKVFKLTVHTTECDDKPAAGADITIIAELLSSDALAPLPWEFTKVTNSSGDCSVKIPAGIWVYTVGIYKGEAQSYHFTSDNSGKQIVYLKFDNGCGGVDLTFNLKPGPSSNSFIIECVPAMPEPKKEYSVVFNDRQAPDYFLGTGAALRLTAFTFTQTSGSVFDGISGIYEQWGWNKDFTQYTYVLSHSLTQPWSGNVKMENTDIFMANGSGKSIMNMLNIKSITIGQNTPVSLSLK